MVAGSPPSFHFPVIDCSQAVREVDWQAGTLIPVDKPKGWTSFDVVGKMRNVLRRVTGNRKIKVGHSGTLDPMAEGLLLIATGKATKRLEYLTDLDKQYSGTFLLGADTASYDAETPILNTYPTDQLSPDDVISAIARFTGELMQIPPPYSAIKQRGKPVYLQARQGKKVVLSPRKVHVFRFEADASRFPEIDFFVHCSKGTYIRSLAHDIGRELNNGAYLTALRRTAIGSFSISDAWNLDDWLSAMPPASDNA